MATIIGCNGLLLNPMAKSHAGTPSSQNTALFSSSSSGNHDLVSSRRSFSSRTLASLSVSFRTISGSARPAEALPFSVGESKSASITNAESLVSVSYSDFESLLRSDRLLKVTFSSDGRSMIIVDREGVRRLVPEVPNDSLLLADLIERKVDVGVEDAVPPENLDTARYIWKKLGGSIESKEL